MNIRRFPQFIKLSLLVLLYAGVFLYALTFPSSFAWMMVYFFTLVFVGAYATTLFSWREASISVQTLPGTEKKVILLLRTKSRLPLLIPRLSFTLLSRSFAVSTDQEVFLKRRLQVSFPVSAFPRGHYSSLNLLTEGYDFLHLFPYISRKKLSATFDVFPELLPDSLRKRALEKSAPLSGFPAYFGKEDKRFRQLRPLQEQDSMKAIDWKTSLRRREWMVKEYEKENIRPLTLCLFAAPSPHFEELVSLAYGLHKDLSRRQPVRLLLLGEFGETIQMEQTGAEFVNIQPTGDQEKLLALWQQSFNPHERRIVVAPENSADLLDRSFPNSLLILTKKDAAKPEVSG